MRDRVSETLAKGLPPGVPKSFRALADYTGIPCTTLQHRAKGRRCWEEKKEAQQWLTPYEETALVNMLVQQDAIGFAVRIKYIREIAFTLACKRPEAERPAQPPGENWPQYFYKRHKDVLKASRSRALDWNTFHIYDKVVHWFDLIGDFL